MKLSLWPLAGLFLSASCAAPDSPSVPVSEPGHVRVAAVQIAVEGDLDGALEAMDGALAEAAARGADIALLPETSIYGWVNPEAHRLADPIPGPTTDRLAELARRHDLMIAVGLAESEAGNLYNSAVLIDSDGTLLLKHRKANILTRLMTPPYTPGPDETASVIDTRLGRIGMLICADIFKNESVKDLAAAEPDLVLVPFSWSAPADQWPEHGAGLHTWISITARRVQAPVVGVDGTGTILHGPWKDQIIGGQSAASDKDGTILGTLADRRPDLRLFEFHLDTPQR